MALPIDSKLISAGFVDSRQGGRSENQDSAGAKETPIGSLVVVCDGMGGMRGGSTASQMAVKSIMEFMLHADSQSNPQMTLVKAIHNANLAIWKESQSNAELSGMGTTVAALLLTPLSAIVAYVGDSRVYQLRNGHKIYRTFDHSVVFEMVKKKVLTEEQARLSEQSNIIMRALGIRADIEVDSCELPYCKGDRFVLCTDGFWGAMPETEFIGMLGKKAGVEQILESTADAVDAIGRKKGVEYDNLTAAIVEMKQNSKLKPKMNRLAKIWLTVLSVLLLVSIALNVYLWTRTERQALVTNEDQEQVSETPHNGTLPGDTLNANVNPQKQ